MVFCGVRCSKLSNDAMGNQCLCGRFSVHLTSSVPISLLFKRVLETKTKRFISVPRRFLIQCDSQGVSIWVNEELLTKIKGGKEGKGGKVENFLNSVTWNLFRVSLSHACIRLSTDPFSLGGRDIIVRMNVQRKLGDMRCKSKRCLFPKALPHEKAWSELSAPA